MHARSTEANRWPPARAAVGVGGLLGGGHGPAAVRLGKPVPDWFASLDRYQREAVDLHKFMPAKRLGAARKSAKNAKALDAKGLDPNRVPSNLAAEIEFGIAQFVERFDLKGFADRTREGLLGGAGHSTDRVRHAHNAHPVPNSDVTARDVN